MALGDCSFEHSVGKLTTIFDQAVPTVPGGFPWLLRASQAHSFLPLWEMFLILDRPFWVVLGIFHLPLLASARSCLPAASPWHYRASLMHTHLVAYIDIIKYYLIKYFQAFWWLGSSSI